MKVSTIERLYKLILYMRESPRTVVEIAEFYKNKLIDLSEVDDLDTYISCTRDCLDKIRKSGQPVSFSKRYKRYYIGSALDEPTVLERMKKLMTLAPSTTGELSHKLQVSRSTITRTTNKLRDQGFIDIVIKISPTTNNRTRYYTRSDNAV